MCLKVNLAVFRVIRSVLKILDSSLWRASELAGGKPEDNASMIREILQGRQGPKRDIVLMNAAPAFVASEKARTLKEGYHIAEHIVDSGAAFEKLEKLINFTQRVFS